ncbi:MAG: type III secretion system cytoplasmic ring protein SctQ [Simkaniaceae bacterium]|nr:type III secretion system cytoplasmic ring protein SctQ [Simkaniaceae bacterium]
MSEHAQSLVKKLTHLIGPSEKVPMWQGVAQFPWENLGASLARALEVDSVVVSSRSAEWKKGETLLSGMGDRPISTAITLSPIDAPIFWVMPAEDAKFFSRVSQEQPHSFTDPQLQKTFYRYLMLEALHEAGGLGLFQELSPKLSEEILTNDEAYCVDVNISLGEQSIWGRLICPGNFHSEFSAHQAARPAKPVDLSQMKDREMTLSLVAGETALSYNEWSQLNVGDFLLLDRAHYHPREKKGCCHMKLGSEDLFLIKFKDDHLKVFDYLYVSEERIMDEEENFEMPLDEAEMPEEEPIAEASAPEVVVNPSEVPLNITVEVGRLQMTLDELMQLKPGNTLPLNIRPEDGVQLKLNGKTVGKGELYQLGDAIGVKISELA